MVRIVQRNAERIRGIRPVPGISLGCTDCRLWRYEGVPAIVYGPTPYNLGRRMNMCARLTSRGWSHRLPGRNAAREVLRDWDVQTPDHRTFQVRAALRGLDDANFVDARTWEWRAGETAGYLSPRQVVSLRKILRRMAANPKAQAIALPMLRSRGLRRLTRRLQDWLTG
jgi:hypothetical protein